jgi:hypothetical protein
MKNNPALPEASECLTLPWPDSRADPNDLRECVECEIQRHIDWGPWQRCKTVERAERESLRTILKQWR